MSVTRTAHSQQPQTPAFGNGAAPLDVVVSRMEEAQLRNRQNYRTYTMTRDYRLFGDDSGKANSEVIAEVTFVPPDRKTFSIQSVQGSERGENIVRKVLQSESEMATKDAPGALSTANYNFALLSDGEMNGRSCYVLQLIPKRQEKTLLKGRAWVDKQTYLVHRVEGDMSKTPSWWLKKVHMTMLYAEVAGMWLPTGTDAVAEVRIFGRHTFTSRAIKVQSGEVVARTFSPVPPNFLASTPHSRSASLVHRTVGAREASAIRHRPTPAALLGAGVALQR